MSNIYKSAITNTAASSHITIRRADALRLARDFPETYYKFSDIVYHMCICVL